MAKITYDAHKAQNGSYIYAAAVTTNEITAEDLIDKAVELSGINIDENIARGLIGSAFQAVINEVAEGNRVYLPAKKGNFGAAYPIIKNSTIRQGDTDSDGDTIPITPEALAQRASTWGLTIGFQVGNNFSKQLREKASLEWNGETKTIASNSSANSDDDEGGNQGNEGEDNEDA